jgi:hypothetical protein
MILGIPFILILAVVVYMVVFVLTTEFLKKLIPINSLILSWGTGLVLYAAIALTKLYEFNFKSVILFMCITGLLNLTYKFTRLKKILKKIMAQNDNITL